MNASLNTTYTLIAESPFGCHAVNDGKFLSRIRWGSWITEKTAGRVEVFMARARNGEIVLRGRSRHNKSEARTRKIAELIRVALTRVQRAQISRNPGMPVPVVMKGRGLGNLRNMVGRSVERLSEHRTRVSVVTNMHFDKAVDPTGRSEDIPGDPIWRDIALDGSHRHDFQRQVSALFGEVSKEWLIKADNEGQPVYAVPSVAVIYRVDARAAMQPLPPNPGGPALRNNHALLNHSYRHSRTMAFRTDCPADVRRMTVLQSLDEDPARKTVKRVRPDQPLLTTSRHDIILAMRKRLSQRKSSHSGLGNTNALSPFHMRILPVGPGPTLGTGCLDAACDMIGENSGLWPVNETLPITRKGGA